MLGQSFKLPVEPNEWTNKQDKHGKEKKRDLSHLCNAKYFLACLLPMRFGHHARCARKILDYKIVKKT